MNLSSKLNSKFKKKENNCLKKINGFKETFSSTFQELQNKTALTTDIGTDGLKLKLKISFQLLNK